jgi:hypothetical protein
MGLFDIAIGLFTDKAESIALDNPFAAGSSYKNILIVFLAKKSRTPLVSKKIVGNF